MKIADFREFGERIPTLEQVISYLKSEHSLNLKILITAFRRLSFDDNFESFEVTVTIPAGAEIGIENKIRNAIPSKRIIVRSNISDITDGATAWNLSHVYLRNNAGTDATLTVIFFK